MGKEPKKGQEEVKETEAYVGYVSEARGWREALG